MSHNFSIEKFADEQISERTEWGDLFFFKNTRGVVNYCM